MAVMQIFFTFFAGMGILIATLYVKVPYFVHDFRYVCKMLAIKSQRMGYRKREPFYTLLDRFLDLVKSQPGKPFILFEDEVYTYQDVDKQSTKVARALKECVRLEEGDTVALFLGNEPCFVWLWLGLVKLGCAAAMLNIHIRSKSLLHCFTCSGAKVLIAAAELQGAVEEVLPVLQEQGVRVFILSEACDTPGMGSLLGRIREASDQPLSPQVRSKVTINSPVFYFYTSGTTGLPKATVSSQNRAWGPALLLSIAGVTSQDVIYVPLPLYHSSGFQVGLTGAIERGITVVLRRKFSASKFWDDCRKYNVTVIQYIGETMRYLCNTPKRDDDKHHVVRRAIGNGIRADVWTTFLERFGNVNIKEFYAASDGNFSLINYVGKVGAVGRVNFIHKKTFPYALLKYDMEREELVRTSDDLCIEVPKGETGLLVSKITDIAPFAGYSGNPEQTERKRLRDVFERGDVYFNSGDLLRIDMDGFIYFQDRVGDTFRWKGENVATTEVSDILTTMASIQDANVYGVRVPGHEGRIGMAAVMLRDGAQFDCTEAFVHTANYLPSYARPRFIRIQKTLELTGTFKQIKAKLVEEGFVPAKIQEPLFFLDEEQKSYIPLTQDIYQLILSGSVKL
ncbi:long-chain fatty acid transport protein 2-like [Osmerus eperlanus]|uniref:long-chain fatty acid transport protein 2-like n=1 Tax=Osmerus eperlanus TaxID=29151 RepID=UPI002E0FF149